MREQFEQLITKTEYKVLYRNSSCKSSSNNGNSEESTSHVTLAAKN
jgi:hypothetical protein